MIEETGSAKEAAWKASCADLILFSATPEGDFPLAVKAWIETWLNKRGDREGMLVGLMDSLADPAAGKDRSTIASATPPITARWIT